MKQYPVEIPYSFSVDLNIKEEHIPFVQVSILTDNVEEEIIEYAPTTKSFHYRDTFYVYGKKIGESKSTLLYFGDPIKRIFRWYPADPRHLGGWIREKWRAKYLVPEIYYGYSFVNWYGVEGDATSTFTINSSASTVNITSPTNGSAISDTTPLLTYTITPLPSTIVVKVDGVEVTTRDGEELDELTNGSHVVVVEARDAGNNLVGSTASRFYVNTSAPNVIVISPANDSIINDNTPLLDYKLKDETCIATVKVDGNPVETRDGQSLGELSEGSHTVVVEAVEDNTDLYKRRENAKRRLGWTTHPFSSSVGFKLKMPPIGTYSTIIVKRNTGLTVIVASGEAGTIFGNVLTQVATPPVFTDATAEQFLRIISGTDVTPGYYKIITHTDDTVTLDSNPGNNDKGDVVYDISDSYSIAQGVNPDYDVPDYYTFPNLTRCEYQFSSNGYAGERGGGWNHIFESSYVPHYFYSSGNQTREIYVPRPTENINMSKMWLQIGLGRYRLKVYGKFYKWTNQQVKSVQTYPIGTYTFVRGGEGGDDYVFDSKVESTGTLNLYEPEPNPCNVRLLVSYLNNSGQNEIREYSL